MSSSNKTKKKKKYTLVYSTLKTGYKYYMRIPKNHIRGQKLSFRKYDGKARVHTIFESK